VANRHDDFAFRVIIPDNDIADSDASPATDCEAITDTLLETAGVLPNTKTEITCDGHRVIGIARHDEKCWGNIVERVRQLTIEYERVLEKRETAEQQSADFYWDDYTRSE